MESVDVYISPSVQDFNIGLNGYGTEEQRMNQIADVVQHELQRNGITFARNNPSMTLSQVVADSNSKRPIIHLAIHSNAYNGESRGTEIYAHRFGTDSETLARILYKYLEPLTPTADQGVKESAPLFNGQGLYELRRTNSPAALVEVAFHDNPEDVQFIINNIYQIGVALTKGVMEYLGKPYTPDTPANIAAMEAKYNGKYF